MERKTIKTTWEQLQKGVDLETNICYTFIVYRFYPEVFEIDNLHFHNNSPVLLPAPDSVPEDPAVEYFTGLSIIAQALKYASNNSDKKLLVAAHTESIGTK